MLMFFKDIPLIGFAIKWMDEENMDYGPFVAGMSLSLLLIGLFLFGVSGEQLVAVFFALTPVWLPLMLFFIFFYKWMDMMGTSFYLFSGRTTLRIKLPQEVQKSPEAMEFVLAQVANVQNPDNLMQTYLQGKRPLTIGLEIVSIGGEIRFYINCPTRKTRDAVEANLYAQYPGIEVVEEPVDYAAEIPLEKYDEYEVFSIHMGKRKEEVFPIKTYVDYHLHTMPKEEEKVDPITPTLEVLASIRPFERLYVQFICTPHRDEEFKKGQLIKKPTWEKDVHAKIDELMQRDPETKAPVTYDPKTGKPKKTAAGEADFDGMPRITPGEREDIEAMERNVEKVPYSVGMRWLYVSKKGHFNGDLINPVIRIYSQYDKIGRNTIGVRWRTDFNYMFISDPTGKRVAAAKRQELKEYKLRKYFPKGPIDEPKICTVEELATMFHLPGQVALTPTITRIPSTRSEAPSNLPVGDLPQQ